MRKEFFRWLRHIPIVRRKIEEKMSQIKGDFKKDVNKRLAGVTVRRVLPDAGLNAEQVMEEVKDHVNLGKWIVIWLKFEHKKATRIVPVFKDASSSRTYRQDRMPLNIVFLKIMEDDSPSLDNII